MKASALVVVDAAVIATLLALADQVSPIEQAHCAIISVESDLKMILVTV